MNNIRFNSKDHKRYYISQYQNIEVALPANIEEQNKIEETLSCLDYMAQKQEEKIEQLKEYKKGLLQKLFPNPEELKG